MKSETVIGVGGLVVGVGALILTLIVPEFRCFLRLDPQCDLNYAKLEAALKKSDWEKAEQETTQLLLQAANRRDERKFNGESWEKVSCQNLKKINDYWEKNSHGHFGFKIQGGIWERNRDVNEFAKTVGWIDENDKWRAHPEGLNYDKTAPEGHLPGWTGFNGNEALATAFTRFKDCGL
ncbi:GUN4 domain-containing protein [Microcoleus sp. B3-D7]|uniref:GUN4 domain-containing protein n=1 Tax=Microcoleus sp. B3-D7 TaxID=2818659 RepID=UPI002FD00A9B